MKRISLILIILILIVFGVSAGVEDTASLHLSTSVIGVSSVIVGEEQALPESKSEFEGIPLMGTELSPIVFSEGLNLNQYFAVYAMTNVDGTYSVETTAKPLRNGVNGASGYILPYSVTIGSGNPVVVNTAAGEELTLISSFVQSNGLSFAKSGEVALSIASDDFAAAESGSYVSVWTINLIKN